MKNLGKFLKKNKMTVIVIICCLALTIILFALKLTFFPNEAKAIYGDRLDGLSEAKIKNSDLEQIESNLKEKDARGIRRVAQKVCKDVERVTGVCPVIGESLCRTENEVVVAVLGKTSDTDGALAAELIAEMQMDVSSIRGKRESFLFVVTENNRYEKENGKLVYKVWPCNS